MYCQAVLHCCWAQVLRNFVNAYQVDSNYPSNNADTSITSQSLTVSEVAFRAIVQASPPPVAGPTPHLWISLRVTLLVIS